MANRFQFKLLTGSNPQGQYDAIATKDAYTFYLLGNGTGYLGDVPLFGTGDGDKIHIINYNTNVYAEAGHIYIVTIDGIYARPKLMPGDMVPMPQGIYYSPENYVVENITYKIITQYITDKAITDMTTDGYTGDNDTIATTKAIVDYVTSKVSNMSTALTTAFFRKVESHTITTEDLSNPAISVPEGTVEGDIGLLFTADTDGNDGGETYYFISLKNYLNSVYTPENTNSINMTITPDNKIKADLRIKSGEASLKIDETNGGVYLEKTTSINDGDGTELNGPAPSADKLVTEEALVNYVINSVLPAVDAAITEALQNVVTYSEDDGATTS